MRNKFLHLLFWMILAAAVVVSSSGCSDDDNDPKQQLLTQQMLDTIKTALTLNITGNQHNLDFPHDGSEDTPDNTVRDVFSNVTGFNNVKAGALVVKHVWRCDSVTTARKGDNPKMIFVMYKREAGYYPYGGDWEYVMIGGDTRTAAHPNGVLPTDDVNDKLEPSGKLEFCAACHLGAKDKDFIWVND